ncbi:MAG TPA: hypothetical protein VLF69_03005 [Candidatus Saccharimonadales bacterium]|nr:hypothetical protein [Candidatus Saccharimonadales bacterium]
MATPKRERIQIDMSDPVRRRAKAVAADRGIALVQLVLIGLSKVGDKKLTEIIEKELEEKARPGRPQAEK